MTDRTFSWVWGIIEDIIGDIEESLDINERKRLRFHRAYDRNKSEVVIKEEYTTIRNRLKANYYSRKALDTESNLIDHHKIAACFCQALLQKKIFIFDMDDDISPEMLLCNYRLAYTASLSIIYIFMLDWYISTGNTSIVSKLVEQQQLLAPQTTTTHASYHE